jgi:hypothetical protein
MTTRRNFMMRVALQILSLTPFALVARAANRGESSAAGGSRRFRFAGANMESGKSAPSVGWNPRVLMIVEKGSDRSQQELTRLRQPGGDFEKLQAQGWKIGTEPDNHLQVVDRERVPELVEKLGVRDYPTVACIDGGNILRAFKSGCTTPLDVWTFGWLAKGIDERPTPPAFELAKVDTTGHYPLRGNHWSVDGDWSPPRETVVSHLRGPHGARILTSWQIESWAYEELRSVHDDLHESETGSSSPHYGYSTRSKSSSSHRSGQPSAGHKIAGR